MKTVLAITATALLGCMGCSGGVYLGSTAGSVSVPISAPSAAPVTLTASVALTSDQVAAVRAHFYRSGNANGRGQNGRGRNGGLPPGIARNLERGKPLPPGIAKQYLPGDLLVRLPRLDDGLDYIVAAGKLLLVEAATQVVRDVLIDVIYS
jgi:hypothetical protein